MKKFTSKKLTDAIEEETESKKEWMLDKFEFKGRHNSKIKYCQFWKEGFHPVELTGNDFMEQKLDYIPQQPG